MGKIFKIAFNVLLILIIVILVGYFALKMTNKIKVYNIETGSMEKTIHIGDYVLIYRNDKYFVGDIVTFKVDDYYITHRIIEKKDGKITTKGDANNVVDDEITEDQIVGKVIYSGGLLNIVINYKFVIAAFLIGLYLLSCYFEEEKN